MLVCLLHLLPNGLPAQSSGVPPSDNFDLSHWSLTLPDSNATVITPAQLTAGFTNSYFYTGSDGAMVFWAPVTGGTTSLSDFPRCELREMLDPSSNQSNWTAYGSHVLSAECRVTQIPSSRRVVIAQIHSYLGSAPPLVLLQFNDGDVEGLVKLFSASSANATYPLGHVGLGNAIQYRIEMRDGVVTMTVNGVTQSVDVFQTDPNWANQTFYFKAGNYCMDHDGTASEGAKVRFFRLNVQHGPSCVITSCTADATRFCLTWTSRAGEKYFVQGLTALGRNDWATIATNITAQGETASYCAPLPSAYRFFRVGMTP